MPEAADLALGLVGAIAALGLGLVVLSSVTEDSDVRGGPGRSEDEEYYKH
jgi:hypothetical protein